MSTAVPVGGVGILQNSDRKVFKFEDSDKVLEKSERSKRIIKSVVPSAIRGVDREVVETQRAAKVTEGVGGKPGPGGPGELQGVDPRTKRMTGESPEEAFLGAVTVCHHRASSEIFFHHRPEREEGGGVAEILGGNAMNLTGRPSDVLIAFQEGNKRIV
jgi:hypothetical protein